MPELAIEWHVVSEQNPNQTTSPNHWQAWFHRQAGRQGRAFTAFGCCDRSLFNERTVHVDITIFYSCHSLTVSYMCRIYSDYSSPTLSHFSYPYQTLHPYQSISRLLTFRLFCDLFSLSRAIRVTLELKPSGVTSGCTSEGNGSSSYESTSSK